MSSATSHRPLAQGHCLLVSVPEPPNAHDRTLADAMNLLQPDQFTGPDAIRHHRHRYHSSGPVAGRRFKFLRGRSSPIVLADEVNRTPRAGSPPGSDAGRQSVGGTKHRLPNPFVLATRNPIEEDYPLPEARKTGSCSTSRWIAGEEEEYRIVERPRGGTGPTSNSGVPTNSWRCRRWCCRCRPGTSFDAMR